MRKSKGQGRTVLDLIWPSESQDYAAVAQTWSDGAIEIMMRASWKGYEELTAKVLQEVDTTQADEELERGISQLLEPCIRRHLSGDEPDFVQHGSYEFATRKPAPAQPPQYDIAFVLRENGKVMWPLEAKVLRTDRAVSRYVRDIREEFLTGRYAPYVDGGGMLGYLFGGSSVNALSHIESALGCPLNRFRGLDPDVHRVSLHTRRLKEPEFLSGVFRCHHLIMLL